MDDHTMPTTWPTELRGASLDQLRAWMRDPASAPAEVQPLLADRDMRAAINAATAHHYERLRRGEPTA